MTKTAKMATVAALALVSSFVLMFVMQANAPHHAHLLEAGSHTPHSMSVMWDEMGWMMALGPLAGLLFFAGVVTVIALIVRWISK